MGERHRDRPRKREPEKKKRRERISVLGNDCQLKRMLRKPNMGKEG